MLKTKKLTDQTRKAIQAFKLFLSILSKPYFETYMRDNKENGKRGGRKSKKVQKGFDFKKPKFIDLAYGLNHLSKR